MRNYISISLFCFLVFVPTLIVHSQYSSQGRIRIALLENARSTGKSIEVRDLVEFSGGDQRTRNKIEKLRFNLEPEETKPTISKSELLAKLLLSGIDSSDFDLVGSDEVEIYMSDPSEVQRKLKQVIQRHVSKGLNIDEQSIQVRIDFNESRLHEFETHLSGGAILRPLGNAENIVGQKTIEIGAYDGDQFLYSSKIVARTSIQKAVLISSRPISVGEPIEESNTFVETKEFLKYDRNYSSPENLIGQVSKRQLRAQQIILNNDVGSIAKSTQSKKQLIKSRDIVNVVANKAGMRITLSGAEALRGGYKGDVIPLRNPTSKEKIYGRIINRELVELVF